MVIDFFNIVYKIRYCAKTVKKLKKNLKFKGSHDKWTKEILVHFAI